MNLLKFLCYFCAPMPLLLVAGWVRTLRRRKHEEIVEALATPFAPELVRADGWFLRHFTLMQRVYLRQQIPAAWIGFAIVLWLIFSLLAPSLFPPSVGRYELNMPETQRAWFSFLIAATLLPSVTTMIALFTAVFADSGLSGKETQTAFNRTRPLEHRFMFWGRVLPALVALVFGFLAGILLAFGALVAIHGAAWRHLDPTLQLQVLRSWDSNLLVWLLISPWKIFVAIGADMMLVFGIAMIFSSQTFRFRNIPKGLFSLLTAFFVFEAFSMMGLFRVNDVMGLSRLFPILSRFGLAADMSHVQPPMTMYLLPLALSVIMLWFAQLAAARKED